MGGTRALYNRRGALDRKKVIRSEDITVSELDRYEAEPQVSVNLYYPILWTAKATLRSIGAGSVSLNASNQIHMDLYKNHVPDDGSRLKGRIRLSLY